MKVDLMHSVKTLRLILPVLGGCLSGVGQRCGISRWSAGGKYCPTQ